MALLQEITGVILAGGQSSRFGSNKAVALWRNKLLIQHVSDALVSVFKERLLVTNTPAQFEFLNIPMIEDRFKDMGPLAGIHAALSHTSNPWIFVVGCDMPAVTVDLITFICSHAEKEFEAVIPWLEAGPEPLCGLYHKSIVDIIETQLKCQLSQISKLLRKLSVRIVKEEELRKNIEDMLVFSNINCVQDLARLSNTPSS